MTAANDGPVSSRSAPFLLMDFDGVLNAVIDLAHRVQNEGTSGRFEAEFLVHRSPIRVPVGTRARIAMLETLFECVWATSWEDRAKSHLAPELGFGANWPVIHFQDDFPDSGTWKLPVVRRFAELPGNDHRPLAWIDDDLEPDALEWASHRTRAGVPTLMVRPDEDVGFTGQQFDHLVAFHTACQPVG
jgi:hypothetical protein